MACYLINRSPRAALDRKVAEEVWTGNEVDYSRLKMIGCCCQNFDIATKDSLVPDNGTKKLLVTNDVYMKIWSREVNVVNTQKLI